MLMGNHNKEKVLGKSIVEVKMSSGKMMILTNVFSCPQNQEESCVCQFVM